MDHFDPELISVVMPCHNAAAHVAEAVASVLGQHYAPVELVVVDDGSTDGSTELLQRLAAAHPDRLTLVHQVRAGPFAARNAGLVHAHGNFVAFLDADDLWHPDALARLHHALQAAGADLATCNWQDFGEAATDSDPHSLPELDAAGAARHILEHGAWPINAVLVRRPLVDELRGFSERSPTAMDDDLWLRLLAREPRLARVNDVLAYRRCQLRSRPGVPRWRQVFDSVAVRRDFARHHPEFVSRYTPAHLHALIHDPLLREAYRCHWRNDTESARRLFRRAFRKANWKAGDLKHLIASLLPAPLYRSLVDTVTRRRSVRLDN
ncbi:MAG: glycosyltransferase family A protein [Pseudomonadota bacterium]